MADDDALEPRPPLGGEFTRRLAAEPRAAVVAGCRQLSDLDRRTLILWQEQDALDALDEDRAGAGELEQCGARLRVLAEASGDDPDPAEDLREHFADHRRARRWRAERDRAAPGPRVREAAGAAALRWREEPLPDRLRRLELLLRPIQTMAAEADADGDELEAEAIRRHASTIVRLRQALRSAEDGGPSTA